MENIVHNQGNLVYHYTSLNVLMKMMDESDAENIFIHASGMHCMNDSSEFIYGFKQFRKLLPAVENKLGIIPDDLKLSRAIDNEANRIDGNWDERYVKTLLEKLLTPFVISTSSNGDNIPMWEMYGDAGRGVAIGIDIGNVYVPIKKPDGTKVLDFSKYNWNDIHAIKIVQHLSLGHPAIILTINAYRKYLEDAKQREIDLGDLQVRTLYTMCVLTSALIKHPAFQFEKEWRILSYAKQSDEICYKTNSKGFIIPYIRVPISKSQFRKIIIGPCNQGSYQKELIERLLVDKKMTGCKVVCSKVPLNG